MKKQIFLAALLVLSYQILGMQAPENKGSADTTASFQWSLGELGRFFTTLNRNELFFTEIPRDILVLIIDYVVDKHNLTW